MEALDEIERLIGTMAGDIDWPRKSLPELLALLEKGEDWVKEVREFVGN